MKRLQDFRGTKDEFLKKVDKGLCPVCGEKMTKINENWSKCMNEECEFGKINMKKEENNGKEN